MYYKCVFRYVGKKTSLRHWLLKKLNAVRLSMLYFIAIKGEKHQRFHRPSTEFKFCLSRGKIKMPHEEFGKQVQLILNKRKIKIIFKMERHE